MPLTPMQREVLDDLLQVGADRPTVRLSVVDELKDRIVQGTTAAIDKWTESRLFLTKGQVTGILRCEGQVVADMSTPRTGPVPAATAAGILAHRAIQLSCTNPGRSMGEYVSAAIPGALTERGFSELWEAGDLGVQSDILNTAISRATSFIDSWPPLLPEWTPRFEEQIVGRAGKVTLSSRADLVLGRPRPDGRQTMFLADLKTGALHENHLLEARFYALASTLRNGIPPFRSTVFSLASGEYTDPDVTEEVLFHTADLVIQAAVATVEVLAELRDATLTPGKYCRWCAASNTCPASDAPRSPF